MPSNRSKAKSKEMESDDPKPDSSTKINSRTRSTTTARATETKTRANKRTANKNGLSDLNEEPDSEKDKGSKSSDDKNLSDQTDKPSAKRANKRIEMSAESVATAATNIETNSSQNDDTADEEPLKASRANKALKRTAAKPKTSDESTAAKGRKVTQKGGRKTSKRIVEKYDDPEDKDVDDPEDKDVDDPEDKDVDEPEDKDVDEPKDINVDEPEVEDVNEPEVKDSDEPEVKDVDKAEDDDDDELKDVLKGSNGKADSSKVRDGDYDLSNDVDGVDFFNLPKTANNAPKPKKGLKKTATKPTKDDEGNNIELAEDDLPKASRGRKAAARKAGVFDVDNQNKDTAEEQRKSSRVKEATKKTDDKIEDTNGLKSDRGRKPPTRGGPALAKKSARISVKLKERIPSKDDEGDGEIAPKTARGGKVPVKKTAKTTVVSKAEVLSHDDDEVSADNEDFDVAPKTARGGKVPVKKTAKTTVVPKAEVLCHDDGEVSSDNEDGDVAPKTKRGGKVPVKKTAKTTVVSKAEVLSHDDGEVSSDNEDGDVAPKTKRGRKIPMKKAATVKDEEKCEDEKLSSENGSSKHEKGLKSNTVAVQVPVDPECEDQVDTSHVYREKETVYDAMLNQTNVQNNNNKFYLLQLLEDNAESEYSVWLRWGRVGVRGQVQLTPFGSDLAKAKKMFEQKFKEKTKNEWSERAQFEKVAGKYDLLAIDYAAEDKEPVELKVEEMVKPKSQLDPKLQSFMELIFNIKNMEDIVKEMKYDSKKSPLGKLTAEQVKAGYAALKKVEECILENKMGKELIEACNTFYTRIPHVFGMKRPPLIQNVQDLEIKIELLKTLGDIQVAMTILNEKVKLNKNPIDFQYESLKCNLKPISKDDSIFLMINDYLQNTHADTHRTYNMELVDLFDCDRELEESNYKDVGNRMLLWHGSRLTNAVGILTQGLRIAPPEAPSTGYMFGKGVYFADMSSKSANYCYTNSKQNEGILYLCEVSVGTPNKLLSSDCDANKLPDGCHSVLGQGSVAPDPKMFKTLPNGTLVPMGKGIDSGVNNTAGYTLNYNEYIVYDVNQIKLKYVLRVKFLYKY